MDKNGIPKTKKKKLEGWKIFFIVISVIIFLTGIALILYFFVFKQSSSTTNSSEESSGLINPCFIDEKIYVQLEAKRITFINENPPLNTGIPVTILGVVSGIIDQPIINYITSNKQYIISMIEFLKNDLNDQEVSSTSFFINILEGENFNVPEIGNIVKINSLGNYSPLLFSLSNYSKIPFCTLFDIDLNNFENVLDYPNRKIVLTQNITSQDVNLNNNVFWNSNNVQNFPITLKIGKLKFNILWLKNLDMLEIPALPWTRLFFIPVNIINNNIINPFITQNYVFYITRQPRSFLDDDENEINYY